MCRGAHTCSELGSEPANWSTRAPLVPPLWFEDQLDLFNDAVQSASTGDVARAVEILGSMQSDHLREWYVEHGQNSGGFRHRHLGKPGVGSTPTATDDTRLSSRLERDVFKRDGYRCRYCGHRVVPNGALRAFRDVVGTEVFPTGRSNAQRHGVEVAFRAGADHVVHWKLGGPTSMENLVTACWSCNFGKYYFTLQQIGLDDPRTRPPVLSGSWDGLVSLIPALRRQSGG